MIVRAAAIGLLSTGLTLASPAASTNLSSAMDAASTQRASPAGGRAAARRAVVPPPRPASAPPAASGFELSATDPGTGFQLDRPPPTASSVLPPLRPSLLDAEGAIEAVAAPLPPEPSLRPAASLEGDKSRLLRHAEEPAERASRSTHNGPASFETRPPAAPQDDAGRADRPVRQAILPPSRPGFPAGDDPVETASLREPSPGFLPSLFAGRPAEPASPEKGAAAGPHSSGREALDRRIAHHARLNDVPVALVHRVVVRESRYNPRAVGRGGALGLMQIKHATARGMGYGGTAAGLLDAETNLTYAVMYLAGAYRVAGGNHDRAVANYARGYYYEAKRLGLLRSAVRDRERIRQADAEAAIGAAPFSVPLPPPPPVPAIGADR